MSMTLFSFGHPCEHQLRRTCIGGSSCPLNGYPDIWCCSYIKGKINFKRDKPCEGPRCRWGFTHPTQQQFDAVTQVLNESRPIAAKIDEAEDKELLTFHLDNPHIVDTVQCALHMMRHPPSSCAQRVGQLLAFAAVKSGEPRVLMQLLKTMKRPMDSYILGAYHYLTQGNPPAPTGSHGKESGAAGGGKNKKGGDKNGPKKEDVVEELKGDLVELMNAALSQGGHLVDRDDQHVLQATFIQALKQYPRSNKRRQEQLEAALAKFGNRQMPKEQPKTAAGTAAATTTATAAAPTATTPATATTTAAAGTEAKPTDSAAAPADAVPTAAKPAVSEAAPVSAPAPTSTASTTAATTPKSAAVTTPKLPPAGATTAAAPESALAATPKQPAATAAATAAGAAAAPTTPSAAAATPSAASQSSPAQPPSQTTAPPAAAQPLPPPPPPQQPVVGISRLVALRPATQTAAERMYEPIRTDLPLPDIFILGGLFNLSPNAANQAPLGLASVLAAPNTAAPSGPTAPAGSLPANSSNNSSAAHTNAFNVGTHVGPGGVNPPASHPNFNPKVSSSSSSSPQQAHYAHPGTLPHPAPHQQQHVQQPSLHHHQQQQQQQGHHSHSHAGPGSMKYIPMPLSQQQQQQQSAMMHALGHAGAGGVHNAGGNAHTAAHLVAPQPQQQAPQLTIGAASNAFADSIFGNLSAEHIFDNLDTNQLFKDYEERWAS